MRRLFSPFTQSLRLRGKKRRLDRETIRTERRLHQIVWVIAER